MTTYDDSLCRILVIHEDGFEDECRVRTDSIAHAIRVCSDPANYDPDHGDVVSARFIGWSDDPTPR